MKRLSLIVSSLLAAMAPAIAADSGEKFSDGVFIVNEDWYGHQNSTVNWISDDWEWDYRVFQQANEGKELGCTNQYGQIYGGRFYLIAKQERDPGATIKGGRITVADARTMKCLFQSDLIDPSGTQCDGRGCLGIDEHKVYISSSNGVWVFDTDTYEVTGQVKGSANPNGSDGKPNTDPTGSLYHGQCGTMVRVNDRVFVAHQSEGILVVDPDKDETVDVITMQPVLDLLPPRADGKPNKMPGVGSVVLAKDGSVWASVAKTIQGDGTTLPYLMRIDPATLEIKIIEVPNEFYPPANSWYAWTPDGFSASVRENVLYWNGGPNSWFSNTKVFKYDIDRNEFSKIVDLEKEAEEQRLDSKTSWHLYGCSLRPHPVTDRLYMSLFHIFVDPTYKLRVTDNNGESIKEVDMISNYWFPSLPVFPDNYMPEVHDPGVIALDGAGPWTVSLDGVFTDFDSMESAIVKTVTGVSDPDAIEAKIVNGDLLLEAKKPIEGGEYTIDIKANSNGEIVTLPLCVSITSAGIEDVVSENSQVSWADGYLEISSSTEARAEIYAVDGKMVLQINVSSGHNRYPTAINRGIYIVKVGKSTTKITVR